MTFPEVKDDWFMTTTRFGRFQAFTAAPALQMGVVLRYALPVLVLCPVAGFCALRFVGHRLHAASS